MTKLDRGATRNLDAAKTQLAKLVDRAAAGEEIVIEARQTHG